MTSQARASGKHVIEQRRSSDPDLLTTRETAEYLGVTVRTVFSMADRGEITPLAPAGYYIKPPVRYFQRGELEVVRKRRFQGRELVPYLTPKRRAALAAQDGLHTAVAS